MLVIIHDNIITYNYKQQGNGHWNNTGGIRFYSTTKAESRDGLSAEQVAAMASEYLQKTGTDVSYNDFEEAAFNKYALYLTNSRVCFNIACRLLFPNPKDLHTDVSTLTITQATMRAINMMKHASQNKMLAGMFIRFVVKELVHLLLSDALSVAEVDSGSIKRTQGTRKDLALIFGATPTNDYSIFMHGLMSIRGLNGFEKNIEAVTKYTEQLLNSNPQGPLGYIHQAAVAVHLRQYDHAAQLLTKNRDKFNSTPEVDLNIALLCKKAGNITQAITLYEKVFYKVKEGTTAPLITTVVVWTLPIDR